MRVPLVDLRAAFQPIRRRFLEELDSTLERMDLFLGPNVQAFEREFAAYCGVAEGVGVASGTAALGTALRAVGLGPGDEVIVPAHTFFATVEAIVHTGATPVLVDVEPETLTLDPAEVAAAVTPATRALLPVHLYGHPADMDPLLEIAREHGLRVIEDAAQAHGALYRGRRCGSLGDAGCFSFYFTKNLGALGEAGLVTTPHGEIARTLRLLRNHGRRSRFEHEIVGDNLRLDEIQAIVLRLQLERLDQRNRRRRELADRYRARFDGTAVRTLASRADCEPVHHVFPIRVPDRDALRDHLARQEIGSAVYYEIPAHRQRALRGHPHRHGDVKVTEQASRDLLAIPIYPELRDEQLDHVATEVLRFVESSGRGRA